MQSSSASNGQTQSVCNETIKNTKKYEFSLIRALKSEYFLYIVSLVSFFGLWQWAATSNVFGYSSALATPFQVVESLHDLSVNKLSGLGLLEHLWISTRRVIIGFLIAAGFGIPLGLFMAFNETFRAIVKPIFDMFKPMPPLAWISVAILWFGIGEAPKIFIIVIGSFVPVVLNSYSLDMRCGCGACEFPFRPWLHHCAGYEAVRPRHDYRRHAHYYRRIAGVHPGDGSADPQAVPLAA